MGGGYVEFYNSGHRLALGHVNDMRCLEKGNAFLFVVPRLFEEKRRDIVFGIPSFRPSVLPSFRPPNIVGTLCAQLLLQFYADSFETLQMF